MFPGKTSLSVADDVRFWFLSRKANSARPRQVRHDNTVTWLAYWKDPVNDSQYKYVWLAANSSFKSDSDLAKYEKARKLKDYIGPIRCRVLSASNLPVASSGPPCVAGAEK